ncbi:MAG TPA: hypothetical protein VFJ82_22795 [Longimicrobium sp.]|nr:hypothetical protein [Longimicrobium sp.]
MRRAALLLVIPLCALPASLPAQRAPAGLRARMNEFLRSIPEDRRQDTTRRFFPRSGDWSYTHTVHLPGGDVRVQRWVFPAAQTSLLFGFGKEGKAPAVDPVTESFEIIYEGQRIGMLIEVIMRTSSRWRLVGGNRFVPPGAPASYPVYVEWRKEQGRWVISSFGDESWEGPRVLGYAIGDVTRGRGLPDPPRPAYAAGEPWLVSDEPITFEEQRYVKYGQPREITPDVLEQVGWHGDIRVYAERGHACMPAVLYVPIAPDSYQPYMGYSVREPPVCPR